MSTSRQAFSPAQRELLDAVLDRIIPPQENRPGAGSLGIGDFVEGVAVGEPGLTRLFVQGLAAIEIAAAERGAGGFAALSSRGQGRDAAGRRAGEHRLFRPVGPPGIQWLLLEFDSF